MHVGCISSLQLSEQTIMQENIHVRLLAMQEMFYSQQDTW